MIVAACVVELTVALEDKLDKFLAVLGAISCTPIAFGLPVAFHLKLVAKDTLTKAVDIFIVICSLLIMGYCTTEGIITWND